MKYHHKTTLILSIFSAMLLTITPSYSQEITAQHSSTHEQTTPSTETPQEAKVIGYFDESWGNFSKTPVSKGFVRHQLKVLEDGNIQIQDFYYPSMKPQTSIVTISPEGNIESSLLDDLKPISGKVTGYFENGKIEWVAEYTNHTEESIHTGFYESGKKNWKTTLKQGKTINVEMWDEKGNLINTSSITNIQSSTTVAPNKNDAETKKVEAKNTEAKNTETRDEIKQPDAPKPAQPIPTGADKHPNES